MRKARDKGGAWGPIAAPKRLEAHLKSWTVPSIKGIHRPKEPMDLLKEYLGKNAQSDNADVELFVRLTNEALLFFEIHQALTQKSGRPKDYNLQLTRLARHAAALAAALEGLDSDPAHLLSARRARKNRQSSISNLDELRELAADAKSCLIPIRRGAPINGSLILLTRDVGHIYQLVTGRRPTNYVLGPFHQILLTVFDAVGIRVTNLAPIYRRAFPKSK